MFTTNDASLNKDQIKVGLGQLAPVWLDREATTDKVVTMINQAGAENVDLVAFGEALIPGYPFWVSMTDGARFKRTRSKRITLPLHRPGSTN